MMTIWELLNRNVRDECVRELDVKIIAILEKLINRR